MPIRWCKEFESEFINSEFYFLKLKTMKPIFLLLVLLVVLPACSQPGTSKNKPTKSKWNVGGGCEGCEAIYEGPTPFTQLNEVDTLPDFNEPGPKIVISGTVYKRDGKTPAAGVILYVYHTDQKGIYATKGTETGWGKRHGYIRGWLKTDKNGFYKFYTLIPASYPNSKNPKHIHPVVKEPDVNEYWIDEFVFEDDPLLPKAERTKSNPVGGSGVLKTHMKDGIFHAERNIILGLHVKDYPTQ